MGGWLGKDNRSFKVDATVAIKEAIGDGVVVWAGTIAVPRNVKMEVTLASYTLKLDDGISGQAYVVKMNDESGVAYFVGMVNQ